MSTSLQHLRHFLHPLRREWRARIGVPARTYIARLRLRDLEKRGRLLEVEVCGLRLRLTPRGAIAEELCREGTFEAQEVALILSLMGPGRIFFDIGANIGLFTLAVAKRYPDAPVFAFEPCAATVKILERNLALIGISQARAVHVALMDRVGTAELRINTVGKDGLNTLGQPTHSACRVVSQETVSITTLDDFLAAERLTGVDVMKVDVEGAELLVLRGGRSLLSSPQAPVILYEGYSQTTQGFGYQPPEIARLLHGCGYRLFALNSSTGSLAPVEEAQATEAMLLAAKPSHIAALPLLAEAINGTG